MEEAMEPMEMEFTVEQENQDKEVIDFLIGAVGLFGLVILAIISAL
jgi:nitrate reductase NapE component